MYGCMDVDVSFTFIVLSDSDKNKTEKLIFFNYHGEHESQKNNGQ
jgi:hypothetical protein